MGIIGAQNLALNGNMGLQVVNGRELGLKVNANHFGVDANGLSIKDGGISSNHLDGALSAQLSLSLKRAAWTTVSSNFTLNAAQQPASLPDTLFTGKSAGGSVNGNGEVGVVAGLFASGGSEVGNGANQAALGLAPSADRPYPSADFPGQHGIWVVIQKKDGDDVLLADVLTTADGADTNARVYGYLSYRSDLPADSRWRLWLHHRRASDGFETPFTPDITLTGLSLHVAEVFATTDLPVRSGLGLVSPAGQAAAAVGPKSIGSAELDDAAVTAGKLADNAVGGTKITDGAIGTAKLAAEAVDSSKLKTKRRFERIVGNATNGATLTLSRAVATGREEGVILTEDGAPIDYVASSPDVNPSKEFTVAGVTITLGYTQIQGAVYRIWQDSDAA